MRIQDILKEKMQLFFAAERVRLIGDYPDKGFNALVSMCLLTDMMGRSALIMLGLIFKLAAS